MEGQNKMNKINIYMEERYGKMAIYVETEKVGKRNIWDLRKEDINQDVWNAIFSAFHFGIRMHLEMIEQSFYSTRTEQGEINFTKPTKVGRKRIEGGKIGKE